MLNKELYNGFNPVKSPRVKRLIALSVLTMLLVAGIVLYQAFDEYELSTKQAELEAQRLSTIAADQIEQGIQAVDLSLQHAVERQHLNMLFGGTIPNDMVHNFKLWVDSMPQIVAMVMLNEHGRAELAVNQSGYKGWINYNESLDGFLPYTLLKSEDSEAHVILPYISDDKDINGLVVVARRINKLDGTFGGIVMAAVQPEFFLDFFLSVDTGIKRHINFILNDGSSLFEGVVHPKLGEISESAWHMAKQKQAVDRKGVFIQKVDGRIAVVAYDKLQKLPLTTVVMIDEMDFLAAFWHDRFKDLSFLVIFMVFGTVVSFFVITMAKQVMRVEESEGAAILASQAKSEFLANMGHELRTPLNAIIGFSEMMTAGYFGPMNGKQKERMGDINMCGNHLLHLISDILEFSKGEAGKLEIVEEKVHVPTVIDETIRMMHEKIKSKGVQILIEVNHTLPLLFADKRKLKQVLINIISNAIKFTPPEGTITVAGQLDGNGNMVITVTDTGIGIAEDDIQTALSVFGQVHRSQSHEGTGLGLPLCRMFTELHGGKLTLSSVLGEGTTVRVQFPEARIIEEDESYNVA